MFITFEGIDASGKSTLSRMLYQKLIDHGHTAFLTWEPGGHGVIPQIEQALKQKHAYIPTEYIEYNNYAAFATKTKMHMLTQFLLYCADRNEHIHKTLLPLLSRDCTVICDRYIFSTYAYQYTIDRSIIDFINDNMLMVKDFCSKALLIPDITFYIDVEADTAINRITSRYKYQNEVKKLRAFKEKSAKAYLQEVRTAYNTMLATKTAPYWDVTHYVTLNGEIYNIEDLFEQVLNYIKL